jgi:hypothetical protein
MFTHYFCFFGVRIWHLLMIMTRNNSLPVHFKIQFPKKIRSFQPVYLLLKEISVALVNCNNKYWARKCNIGFSSIRMIWKKLFKRKYFVISISPRLRDTVTEFPNCLNDFNINQSSRIDWMSLVYLIPIYIFFNHT